MRTEVGRVLGDRYQIVAPVGAGGSAQVFLADDLRLQRRVAVKVLLGAAAGDRELLLRFQREAQAAAALNHPNILSVFDWGEDENQPFLVTEYLPGGSLRALLDLGRRLTPAQCLRVGLEAARGLEFAHRHDLVHGHLQPSDLLFGSEGRLRIADFGLARALDGVRAQADRSPSAAPEPSRYAAPEQDDGRPATEASDVCSLGLVLVAAVTGEEPPRDHSRDAAAVPETLGPLRPVLEAAMRTDPTERLDAHGLAVGLMGAAGQLNRPAPLPLAGPALDGDEDTETSAASPEEPTAVVAAAEPSRAVVVPAPPPPTDPGTDPEPFYEVVDVRPRRRGLLLGLVLLLLLGVVAGAFGLVRSSDTGIHRVPDVTGEQLEKALPQVAYFGWRVAITHTRKDGTRPNQVLSATPKVGSRMRKGDRLTLLISDGNTLVRVPTDVRGKSQIDAQDQIQTAGLLAKPSLQFDEDIAEGNVIGLGPNTPLDLPKLDAVALVVSSGPAPRSIPQGLSGLTYDVAAQKIKDLRLKPVEIDRYNDDKSVRAGQVFDTNPKADTEVQRDSEVQLIVSEGPTPVTVPSVAGLSADQAKTVLTNAGFRVAPDVVQNFNDTIAAGQVIGTSPPNGNRAQPGSAVSLTVSQGPMAVTVPSVAGLSADQAKTVLTNAGFLVAPDVVQNFNDTIAAGQVIGTSPPNGNRAQPGSTVSLTVSRGQDLVTVPPVVGTQSVQEAMALLQAAGLQVGGASGAPPGKPIRTDPPAGTRVKRGGVVNIVLG